MTSKEVQKCKLFKELDPSIYFDPMPISTILIFFMVGESPSTEHVSTGTIVRLLVKILLNSA